MRERLLTLDLGNSAIKWVHWGSDTSRQRVRWTDDWRDALRSALAANEHGPLEQALISTVAGPTRTAEVVDVCAELGVEAVVNPDPRIEVACRDAHTIGVDRLYAAAAAWATAQEGLLVVDAGTALTVDAVAARGSSGVFLGGAIAPGPDLLARALADGGAQLFEVSFETDAAALGQDSGEALRAGISVGFRGTVRELIQSVAAEAGLESAPVWLTGGVGQELRDAPLFGTRDVHHDALLVHRGLLYSAGVDRA